MTAAARRVVAGWPFFLMIAIAPLAARAETNSGGENDRRTGAPSPALGVAVPSIEIRGFFGLISGGQIDVLASDRLRLELGQRLPQLIFGRNEMYVTDVAAHIRLLGPAHQALWLRTGYQYHVVSNSCRNDRTHTVDVGAEFRGRSQRGHLFQVEFGPEILGREKGGYVCNDSVIGGAGLGARFSALGQLAVSRHLGLFGRVGVRTAPHLMEIRILPQAEVGLALEF